MKLTLFLISINIFSLSLAGVTPVREYVKSEIYEIHDQYAIIPPEDQQTDSEIERRRPNANDSEISPIPAATMAPALPIANDALGATGDDNGKKNKRIYNIPVLSGSAYVGQLYDAKTGQLMHDRFLWKNPIKINEAKITSTETETVIEETLRDRMSLLDFSASIKATIMGFIEIEGSASYLRDSVQTDEYVRMTFKYAKKGKQITALPTESVRDPDSCQTSLGATHVVTEIKYGFNAFLLFEYQKSESESKQEIGGSLRIVVDLMGGALKAEGAAELKLSATEKDIKNKLKFKFHGDTIIDPPPQTFEDAVKVYGSLPAKSKEDERVVSFSVAPLSDYCDTTDQLLTEIASEKIETIVDIMTDFETVEQTLRKLKNKNLALDFASYRTILLDLEKGYEKMKSETTSKIQRLLPEARVNPDKESDLQIALDEYANSRYEKETFITECLAYRQKEIETAEFIIYNKKLKNNKNVFIDYDNTGDMSKCILGHDYAIVYELEILPQNPKNIVKEHEQQKLFKKDKNKWFNNELEVGKNRPLMNDFEVMAEQNVDQGNKICFLISLNEFGSAKNDKNFQLKLLKSGKELKTDFRAPQKINSIKQTKWDVDSAELIVPISHANSNLPTEATFKYELWVDYWTMSNKDKKLHLKQPIGDISKNDFTLNLKNLLAGSAYQVQFSVVLFEGINQIAKGHVSDPLLFYTVPTSPPDELKCELNTDKSLSFSWKLPRKGIEDSDGKPSMNYHFSYWIEDVHDYKGCLTVANSNGKDSADINKPCVFPWKYKSDGPSFNGCANPDVNVGGNWCATGLDANGIYASGSKKWGFCNTFCPIHVEKGRKSEIFDTDIFDYDASTKQCLNYGKSQKEICEFKAKITEITENMAIESAKAYIFHVQLIAPDLEVKTKLGDSDEITHKIPMKSREKTVECKTKPDKIQGLKLLRVKKTEIEFKWEKYTNLADVEFETYEVVYNKRVATGETPTSVTVNGAQTWKIVGLDGATGYDIWVKVKSINFGYSDLSDPLVVYTKESSESDLTAVQKLDQDYNKFKKETEQKFDKCVIKSDYNAKIQSITDDIIKKNTKLIGDMNERVLLTTYNENKKNVESEIKNRVKQTTYNTLESQVNQCYCIEKKQKIKEILVTVSNDANSAGCNKSNCLQVQVCQNGNCCKTANIGPLSKGSTKIFKTATELGNCDTKEIINIESNSAIDVTLENKSDDALQLKNAKISTSSSSYQCDFNNNWIETEDDSNDPPTITRQCPYKFGI